MLENNNGMLSRQVAVKPIRKGLIIFAFVMIFNPNINIYDFLPDFIGYFILARLFERGADAAPYFEEARLNFVRLAYISLAKIPAVLIVRMVRSENMMDNDVIALAALVFAVLEIIFLIPAIKNAFAALSYLGERTDAESLIRSDSLISTDALSSFTYVFAIFKCLLYSLPEMLRLTRSVEIGSATSIATGSRFYPWAIMASLTLGFVFGGVWLSRMKKYTNAIADEGKFAKAIEDMALSQSYDDYLAKKKKRELSRCFLLFTLAAAATLDLTFDNFDEINLLPAFIFGAIFFTALIKMLPHICAGTRMQIAVLACGAAYITASLVEFVLSVVFLTKFGYDSLLEFSNPKAVDAYQAVEISATVSCALYLSLMLLFFLVMSKFVTERIRSARHYPTEMKNDPYLRDAKKKTLILSCIGAITGISTLLNVIVNGRVKILFTNAGDVTMPAIIVPTIPWFNLVVVACTVAYTLYSIYYFNYVREDV